MRVRSAIIMAIAATVVGAACSLHEDAAEGTPASPPARPQDDFAVLHTDAREHVSGSTIRQPADEAAPPMPENADPPTPTRGSNSGPLPLDNLQRELLQRWYDKIPASPGQSFSELVGRVGLAQLGAPYLDPPQKNEPEQLTIDLATFQCVSFAESVLSVARCIDAQTRTPECFVAEMEQFRYRDGKLGGYSSRLHYFAEWLADNTKRQRFWDVTAELGGQPVHKKFDYITNRIKKFPALIDPLVRQQMTATEQSLSETPWHVLARDNVRSAVSALQSGDVVAIVTRKPGLMVVHTGFIARESPASPPRLLHASSYHQRVVLTPSDIAEYVLRQENRQGIMVFRPLAPSQAPRATTAAVP